MDFSSIKPAYIPFVRRASARVVLPACYSSEQNLYRQCVIWPNDFLKIISFRYTCKLMLMMPFIFFFHTMQAQEKAEHLLKKGMERQQNGEYRDAIDCYNKVIEEDSLNIKAYLQRGFCKVATKDYKGSIDDYTVVINHDPKHVWAYISRGSARNKLEEFKSALADFDQAIALDPQNQEAFNNRGFSKKGMGNEKGACDDWNKSRKMGNDEAKIILKNNHCK